MKLIQRKKPIKIFKDLVLATDLWHFFFPSVADGVQIDGATFFNNKEVKHISYTFKNYLLLKRYEFTYELAKRLNIAPRLSLQIGAVAFDAKAHNENNISPLDITHVCSGSNRFLHVASALEGTNQDDFTGTTYNGVAMTGLDSNNSNNNVARNYYLVAPASGSNVTNISFAGAHTIQGVSVSYTGCKQTGQPDAHVVQANAAVNSQAVNITTIADRCLVSGLDVDGQTPTITAGTNTLLKEDVTQAGGRHAAIFESSSLITPAGLTTLNLTFTGHTGDPYTFLVSIVPVADTGGGFLLNLLNFI